MIEEIKKTNLMQDYLFKNLAKNPKSKWYISKLTASILNKDENQVYKNLIILDSDLFKYIDKEKGHIADVVVLVDNYIVNYEFNNKYYPTLLLDKIRYIHHLYNIYFPKSSLRPRYKIIQVNINNFNNYNRKYLRNTITYKDDYNRIMSRYEKIIMYSLEMIKKKWYNKTTLNKTEKLLLLLKLSENIIELEKFIKEDEYMRKLNAKEKLLIDIYNSLDNAFDYEEEKERQFNCILDYEKKLSSREGIKKGFKKGVKRGIEQGIEQGVEQGLEIARLDIAKNLIKLNMPRETILEATGLQSKEYDKLISTN